MANLKTKESLILDYDIYFLSYRDLLENALKFLFLSLLICIAFYNSIILFFITIPIIIVLTFFMKPKLRDKRKKKLLYEFKDFLRILKSFLDAGYSIENAFLLSKNELKMLYDNSLMLRELEEIIKKIQMNKPIEIAFKEFSDKTKIDDIEDFSEVFVISKKFGGNINDIIKNTTQIINDKIEIERDIQVLTAQKQFEQNIMNLLPFFIIIYLNISSSDYLITLYTTLWGRMMMTAMLFIYFFSVMMSKKILDIKV